MNVARMRKYLTKSASPDEFCEHWHYPLAGEPFVFRRHRA